MKFKVDDEVRVIASKERLEELSIGIDITGQMGVIVYVGKTSYDIKIGSNNWCVEDQDIELAYTAAQTDEPDRTFVEYSGGRLEIKNPPPGTSGASIRTFDTGATRDTAEGKLDYVRALSPIVLRRYVQYLNKHRLQSDGSYRDFDNWKKGIPQETYLSSGARHFMAVWLLAEGYEVSDNHGPVNEEDALCGEIFNAMGKLHEILKAKLNVAR